MSIMSGIHFRLYLLGVLPAGLIGLAMAAYFVLAHVNDLNQGLNIRGELLVRELARASAVSVLATDQPMLRNLADAALLEDDVVEVSILDLNGGVLVKRVNLPGGGAEAGAEKWLRTAPILSNPAQVGLPNAHAVGTVSLMLSRAGTLSRQRETILFSTLALLSALAVSALLARRMARKISEPVMALTIAVHELSNGNLDVRAEAEAEAELEYLQAGFNAMAAELKKSRDSLERQVKQATASLQEALAELECRNQALESARWLAEAQTELKSRFLAQMSHEIRTPMNGIIGFSELLAKTPLAEDQAEKLGLITRSAKNLLSIINEILDLSKLEAGQIVVECRPFVLRPCLEDVISLLAPRTTRLPIVLSIAPDVPRHLMGDPVRIQQVVANLLSNAIKFTRHGRIVIRVRALADGGGGERLLFSVSDSGGGISPQDQAKLFSPFMQLGERAASAAKGAGLGLSISKNIVESMGGKIHLASRHGKGTSFWFGLPLVAARVPPEPPALQGLVGLIESDRLFRQALAGQLRELGATVEACASLEAFIERCPASAQPLALLFVLTPSREKPDLALPCWEEWCSARRVKPILVFPGGERRLVGFYRKRGAACLFQPVRNRALVKAITGPEPVRAVAAQPAPLSVPRGLSLLVADDNDINRLLLRAQMDTFEAEILEARNGQEALDLLRRQRFDVVFLDLQMPLLSGAEVLRQVRDEPGLNQHVPIIAITAFSARGQREAAMADGFTDCLIKPILLEQLVSLLTGQLGSEDGLKRANAGAGWAAGAEGFASAILEKAGGNRQLAGVVARKLFVELPEMRDSVQFALAGGENEKAQHCVHIIHGSASFCGLNKIRIAATSLELALDAGEDGEILQALCEDMVREIEVFLVLQSAVLGLIDGASG